MVSHRFYFLAESRCLDFVNTVPVRDGKPDDLLATFDDMVAWCEAAEFISPSQAKDLVRRWRGDRRAARALALAHQFRERLGKALSRLADGHTGIAESVLDAINELLRKRAGDLEIRRTSSGYQMEFRAKYTEPEHLLGPIAESAARLLSDGDLSLVKKCQNPDCVLYFYDTTKNHGRRWCSMTACGNRAKVAAHYERARRLRR